MNESANFLFDDAGLCNRMGALDDAVLDKLSFGIPGFDEAAIVRRNNAFEARASGPSASQVMGGEEFAVLLPSTDRAGAAGVANRLRQLLESTPVEVDGQQISYTLNGGIAAMDDDVTGLDALIKRADRARHAAKVAGRDRIECRAAELDHSGPPKPGRLQRT